MQMFCKVKGISSGNLVKSRTVGGVRLRHGMQVRGRTVSLVRGVGHEIRAVTHYKSLMAQKLLYPAVTGL